MDYSKDYYNILGLTYPADIKDIKSKYRKLAMRYHPDKCKNAECEKQFKLITEAFDILSDDRSKSNYDSFYSPGRTVNINMNATTSNSNHNTRQTNFQSPPPPNFSDWVFQQRKKKQEKKKKQQEKLDIIVKIKVTLFDIYNNIQKKYIYTRVLYDDKGNKIKKTEPLEIKNLYNCINAKEIVKPGRGHQSKKNKHTFGKLTIIIEESKHSDFKRVGTKLYTEEMMTKNELIHGSVLQFLNLNNKLMKINVPAGTKNNQILVLKKAGLIMANGERDNLYITIKELS